MSWKAHTQGDVLLYICGCTHRCTVIFTVTLHSSSAFTWMWHYEWKWISVLVTTNVNDGGSNTAKWFVVCLFACFPRIIQWAKWFNSNTHTDIYIKFIFCLLLFPVSFEKIQGFSHCLTNVEIKSQWTRQTQFYTSSLHSQKEHIVLCN